ncbi:hypothetical protein GWP85_10975 [Acinetobacter beijerinckii]|uniref:host specificity factor TipJ family phage tail protein n=1 Tax=Acinetobacter beijerinckii TaxID=262668 RepID=UPI0023DD69A9|nr:host specificity factor TipJ family phage tail protein [Acinetobacter beijerinckii]MDF2418025.1 hypothetical protein [Acinetobacter beijerinckii]
MSQICIINNALDGTEKTIIETDNILYTFLQYKAKHPQAQIFKGNPCPENNITPIKTDRQSIARLTEIDEDCTIVLYSGDIISAVNYVVAKIFGAAIKAIVKIPKIPNNANRGSISGSSNNNLSNRENKQRLNQRIPYILGRVKSIPDLFAPTVRYFKDAVEVEESLMCICENPVQVSNFKEGDTPIQEIPGTSVTVYAQGQSLTGTPNIFKWGDTFDQAPVIAKQTSSINGQTLLPPNSTRIESSDIFFQYPNLIKAESSGTAEAFSRFDVNESIIISGANYGIADLAITGPVTVDNVANTLEITTAQTVLGFDSFRKINISSLMVNDPVNDQLDLAGLYDVQSITFSGGVYTITLLNPTNTNSQFSNLTEEATTNISANLTANSANIFLDGNYIVTGVDVATKQISLATPSGVNTDWNKLADLTDQKTPVGVIKLRGAAENYIGWFTIDSPNATGLLLNFQANNGIYQGSNAKTVSISVEYQQVIAGVPTGPISTRTIDLVGKASNRDSVGGSIWIDLAFVGAVRFRARRTNDNGDEVDLSDETKFYSAYAYHYLQKLVYDNRVLLRSRTQATRAATSLDSRELNCIAESLVYTYSSGSKSLSRIASRNIADLTIELALHPKIGRRSINEVDIDSLYSVVAEINDYFGSIKLSEFNYTLDDANQSFEEVLRMIAGATGCHDRRSATVLYYDFERADNLPSILFNHRNKKPQSEYRTFNFKIDNSYDGIELTYVDSEAGWIEKTLKLPNDQINNPKKLDGYGIVYKEQAHIAAWRAWNKLKFQRTATKFNAYAEAELVNKGDVIAVVDDTRLAPVFFGDPSDMILSGEVLGWSGLEIRVSQPCILNGSHNFVIHLQLKGGQIDVIPISQGQDQFHFVLSRPPNEALVIQGEVKTVYSITTDDRQNDQLFLLTEKSVQGIFEHEITAINFDQRYYQNDSDIKNNLI